jgi:small subunit ribosomal protein S17
MSNRRKRLVGQVVTISSEKTVKVRVDRTHRHPLYQKVLRSKKIYLVHDEQGCQVGDRVRIVESRPISKRKRWAVEEVVQRAGMAA